MTFEEKLKLVNHFDRLVRKKMPGNASLYASKLGISRSAFFRLLEAMREEFNIPIIYNIKIQCYEYEREGIMYFGFISSDVLSMESLRRINGGIFIEINDNYFYQSQLVGLPTSIFDIRFLARDRK